MRTSRRLSLICASTVIAGTAIFGPPVFTPQNSEVAQAGALCDSTGICGKIRNHSSSPRTLPVTCNLGDPWKDYREVRAGYEASCKDDDAFHVPYGYYGIMTGIGDSGTQVRVEDRGWFKVPDNQSATVRIYKK